MEELICFISSQQAKQIEGQTKIIYSAKELLENYPMFTKYSLDKMIKNNNLPHFRIGYRRFFDKERIDKWIDENINSFSNNG